MGKQFNILKRARDAQFGHTVRLFPLDLHILEKDTAPIGFVNTVDAIKERGLSRTIGADNGKNGTFPNLEVNVFEGHQAPE
jgi:hypothetical protein